MNSHPDGPSANCSCPCCRALYPIEDCYYCGQRAESSQTMTDGTMTICRHYCARCWSAMRDEHEAMYARTPQALRDAAAPNPAIIPDDDDNNTALVDGDDDY